MARQVGSGVVAAAKNVSDIQNRFQDVGGQFMTGYNKSLEAKKAREAENEAVLARVNKLMDGFTNDIDVIKFKPEDQNVVKNKIIDWRNEYASAANAAAKIKDKSSPEYQRYIDVMNGVQSKMVNLKNNIDGLAAFKSEYADNVKAGTYSIAGQNAMSLAQGETMVTSPIGSITDNGDLQWDAGAGSVREGFSFQDYSKPFAKANNVALELDKIAKPLTTMKTPLTNFDKDYINERVNNLVGEDPNVLASIIADGELKSFNFTDIDPDDPNARDIVVDRLVQAMYDVRGSRVQQNASANGGGSSSTGKLSSSMQEKAAMWKAATSAYQNHLPFTIENVAGEKIRFADPVQTPKGEWVYTKQVFDEKLGLFKEEEDVQDFNKLGTGVKKQTPAKSTKAWTLPEIQAEFGYQF